MRVRQSSPLTTPVLSPPGHTGRLLKSLCVTSLSFLLLHIVFHITLASLEAQHRIAPGYNWRPAPMHGVQLRRRSGSGKGSVFLAAAASSLGTLGRDDVPASFVTVTLVGVRPRMC
ncbi:hypothetical protein CB1_000932053 [Camelus ferus]|nr:hypothetical protein CB1_000932053 [Camelus ferus]